MTKKKPKRTGAYKRAPSSQTESERRSLQIEILQGGHVSDEQAKPVEPPNADQPNSKAIKDSEGGEKKLSKPVEPSHVVASAQDETTGGEPAEGRSKPLEPSDAATPRSNGTEAEKHAEERSEPSEPQPCASKSDGAKSGEPTDKQSKPIEPPLDPSMPGLDVRKDDRTPGERCASAEGSPNTTPYSGSGNESLNHGHQGDR